MRGKEMKYNYILEFLGLFLLVFSLSFSSVSAAFTLGNPSFNISEVYVPEAPLTGWINISFTNQNYNSLFRINENSISVKQLLEKNPFGEYTCSSKDCDMTYGSLESSGVSSQTFNLGAGESKLVGIKITEKYPISSINEMVLNINSNAIESCSSQLSIDLFEDGTIDWVANKPSNLLCNPNYGCYSPSASSISRIPINPSKTYCQQMNVNPAPALRVGANLFNSASGESEFEFSVNELGKSCKVKTSASGDVSCLINVSVDEPMDITICMSKLSGNEYKINIEDDAPVCGSIDSSDWDMAIFASPVKYGSVGNIVLNSSNLYNIDFLSYLDGVYDNCLNGCYIPLRLISGIAQQIDLSKISLTYEAGNVDKAVSSFYTLEKIPSIINSGFLKLNIDDSGFKSPLAIGNQNVSLFLDSSFVFSKTIKNLNVPLIELVSPLEVPVALDSKFYVFVLGSSANNSYTWDFGDQSNAVKTEKPTAMHKFNSIGNYTLELTASNSNGANTKRFSINVISPVDYLNKTITENKNKIKSLRTQIANFSSPVKNYIEKKFNLASLDSTLQQLLVRFESAGGDEAEYISIVEAMPVLNIPDTISLSEKSSGNLFIDKSQLNLGAINTITGETTSVNDEVKSAVFDWVLNNVDATFDIKSYSMVYGNVKSALVSDVILKLSSPSGADEVYVFVNKPKSDIEAINGVGNLISSGSTTGFQKSLSATPSSLEFLVSGNVKIQNMPIYLSPKLSELAPALIEEICNYNRVCEADRKENPENCRSDCAPWKSVLLYTALIMFLFLCLYIGIQEWYKRYYENKLFKNKNELFNLINFMDNAEKQGLKRLAIIERLKEAEWPVKKIEYAYKKYKGERTGVWEIPLFKFIENRNVKSGLAEYRKTGDFQKQNKKQIK